MHRAAITIAVCLLFAISLSPCPAEAEDSDAGESGSCIVAQAVPAVGATNTAVSEAAAEEPSGGKRTIEAQLSGFTSEYAGQVFGRLSILETRENSEWYLRGSLNRTGTRSGSTTTRVTTSRLDTRIERSKQANGYEAWTGILSRRDRDLSATKTERTGYCLASYGIGKQLDARNKGDVGVGFLDIYDHSDGIKPVAVLSVIGRRPIDSKLALDGRILAIQPMDRLRSTKVDSDIGISCELTQGVALRLGWTVNNLIRPLKGDNDWDSVVRLVVSYKMTSKL